MKKESKIIHRNPGSTFSITTLGCKVNQYESDAIAQLLKDSGCVPATGGDTADLYIINTCTVTQKAAMQSRQVIRQAIRSNPEAKIVVTGCYAQTESHEIHKIDGVHHIVGHSDKLKIPDILLSDGNDLFPAPIPRDILSELDFKESPVTVFGNRTRPFLKIQDGCNAFCTYCIVPYARGPSRSMPFQAVLSEIQCLSRAGYHEVVLTGVHLGAYGLDLSPKTSLFELLDRICESRIIHHVRLSSIEPHELPDDIIKLVASKDIFCHHFHIPLQSGDDLILKKMHRDYTRTFFKGLVNRMNTWIPDAAIGVDILVGFPGESDKAFENTYELIENLPVTYLHVFPFSSRPGTPANRYSQKIPPATIKARCERMRTLGNHKKRVFYETFIGKNVDVLIESQSNKKTGLLKGVTSNYIPVRVMGSRDLFNKRVQVKIQKVDKNLGVFGILC